MKQHIISALVLIAFLTAPIRDVSAENIAGHSAMLTKVRKFDISPSFTKEISYIHKKNAIKAILKKANSPLYNSSEAFIEACRTYELDCYLLPAIAGLESGYGKHILQESYNPFGWGGGKIYFKSWQEGIHAVGYGLRYHYINKGAVSIEHIGKIYAASPTWAVRIRSFIDQFEAEEKKNSLYLDTDSVKL